MLSSILDKIHGGGKKGESQEHYFDQNSVITDQKMIEAFFKQQFNKDVQPIATDQFMERSKDQYNSAYLTRELAQNKIDHNDTHPYSLDGVDITETLSHSGHIIFNITGYWKFPDPTGIISLHSEKTSDRKTGGGNGIGLKQVALRLIRDFGVKNFEVYGEEWKVAYGLSKKEDINTWLSEKSNTDTQVRHDWLVGMLEKNENVGKCSYVIETDNLELISSLRELKNIGVSSENSYLQDLDIQNEKGAIKWHKIDQMGRVFINGQVMNIGSQGADGEDYWRGLEGVSLCLNDIDYEMSIDRPPLNPFSLPTYMNDFMKSLSVHEILEQLKKSEQLWNTYSDNKYNSRKGCFFLIEGLVTTLQHSKEYNIDAFKKHFSNEKYIALDDKVTPNQRNDLESQGFIICPGYFAHIGMQKASTKLDLLDIASNKTPSDPTTNLNETAENQGLYVGYENLDLDDKSIFFKHLRSLGISTITRLGTNNTFRIMLSESLPKQYLFHRLDNPNNDTSQKSLFDIRSAVMHGLCNKVFEKVFLSTGEYVSTFSKHDDEVTREQVLLMRNNSCHNSEGCFLEIELSQENTDIFNATFLSDTIKSGGDKAPLNVQVLPDTNPLSPNGSVSTKASVQQPSYTDGGKIIFVETSLDEGQQNQLTTFEKNLPGITDAIKQLDSLIPERAQPQITKKTAGEKYIDWTDNPNYYGDFLQQSHYLNGKSLIEILQGCSQADIDVIISARKKDPTEQKMFTVSKILEHLAKKSSIHEEDLNEFEVLLSPTEQQLEKLIILREFIYLTSGVDIPNDIFLYKGTGSKGINIGQKAIGLNISLLETDFREAIGTYIHEISHNNSMTHNHRFIATLESLFSTSIENLIKMGGNTIRGGNQSLEEKTLFSLVDKWDTLVTV